MQRQQQGSLQEAQAQHQIDVKRRRERIALIERLGNRATRFAQPGIVQRHPHQPLRTVRQGSLQNRLEQLLRLPLAARMEEILGTPTPVLAAVGPNDAGQAAAPHTDQGTERLPYGTLKGALLREHTAPVFDDGEELRQEAHRASAFKEKVFLSGRRKRSPRATFLVREETRLSRSTVTLNWA